jgi:Lysyl oxidase
MRRARRGARSAAVAIAGLGLVAAVLPAAALAASPSRAAAEAPTVKLIAAQRVITVQKFGKQRVFLDPGVWVASLGSPLEFDVQRSTYLQPVTITQVVHLPGGGTRIRALPGSLLDGFNGFRDFFRLTVKNSKGTVVARERVEFCPDFNPERATPDSPATSRYPQSCASDPFQKGNVWGIAKGWAVDPFGGFGFGPGLRLGLGTYRVTMSINRPYTGLLHISPANATTSVKVRVVKATGCCGPSRPQGRAPGRPLSSLPRNVPYLAHPPKDALPDLVPLPSWGITTGHVGHEDFVNFGATVWVGGTSPLDVEGFRSNGSPIMKAYQYFWRNGHIIGRVRAGTMGFDRSPSHSHWHFQQFAQYRLLNSAKAVAVRSQKVGFCIAPTDAVDMLLPGAMWQPQSIGFFGACGTPSSLWVQEYMPVGWGDTYFQFLSGQAFDISHVPNGTYYIEIIANPEKVLRETNTGNDVSLRRIVLGGRPGHRTVRVPAWHGIDPEHTPPPPPVPVPTPSPTPAPSSTPSPAGA